MLSARACPELVSKPFPAGCGDAILLRLPAPLMLVDTAHRGQPPKWHATKPRCPGDTRRTCQGCVEQTQTANGLAGLRFLQRVPGLGLTSDRTGGTLITFPFASWVISDLTWVCACECSDRQPPLPKRGPME